jgi:hypothetical protein
LRGKIREVFFTQANFAKAINLSNASISAKLNNNIKWKQDEIERAVRALNLPMEEMPIYFFSVKGLENQN